MRCMPTARAAQAAHLDQRLVQAVEGGRAVVIARARPLAALGAGVCGGAGEGARGCMWVGWGCSRVRPGQVRPGLPRASSEPQAHAQDGRAGGGGLSWRRRPPCILLACQHVLEVLVVQHPHAQLLGELGHKVGHVERGGQALQQRPSGKAQRRVRGRGFVGVAGGLAAAASPQSCLQGPHEPTPPPSHQINTPASPRRSSRRAAPRPPPARARLQRSAVGASSAGAAARHTAQPAQPDRPQHQARPRCRRGPAQLPTSFRGLLPQLLQQLQILQRVPLGLRYHSAL